jgi:hypothetical protein
MSKSVFKTAEENICSEESSKELISCRKLTGAMQPTDNARVPGSKYRIFVTV